MRFRSGVIDSEVVILGGVRPASARSLRSSRDAILFAFDHAPADGPELRRREGRCSLAVREQALKIANRDALLATIARARRWVEDIRLGRVTSLAEIAQNESQGERYIRMLMALAFVSPRIIAAIIEGTVPADLNSLSPR
jgi:hypothetical protein